MYQRKMKKKKNPIYLQIAAFLTVLDWATLWGSAL